jgi:hypothetical protein
MFALGGYNHFDRDAIDMDQLWIGTRIGDPAFVGVKYIYTTQVEQSAHGISYFAGVLTPTSERIGIGIMVGYDDTGLDRPSVLAPKGDYFWTAFMLQLTLFPAPQP